MLSAPLTVAIRVADWPRMRIEGLEVTETVTTIAALLPPPQPPDISRHRATSPAPAIFKTSCNFTPTISPTHWSPRFSLGPSFFYF